MNNDTCGIIKETVFVNTELNWRSRISALSLLSLNIFPFSFSGDTPKLSFFLLFI